MGTTTRDTPNATGKLMKRLYQQNLRDEQFIIDMTIKDMFESLD